MTARRAICTGVAIAATAVLTACSAPIAGQAVSVFDDPNNVAGMAATDGPSGVRDDAEPSDREVENTDGGEVDDLAAMAVSDLEVFWNQHYSEISDGEFTPVDSLMSWDSTDRDGPRVCGASGYQNVNALYCPRGDTIAWERAVLIPLVQQNFGDMGAVGVLGHEYGHAVQTHAELVGYDESVLVFEQQADCFEGAYMRWVAEGSSARFSLNTTDGLNNVLASVIAVRDSALSEEEHEDLVANYGEHGSAFERVSAFQIGFTDGVQACAAIDEQEIEQRRGDLPVALPEDKSGELDVTDESVRVFVDSLTQLFQPAQPPELTLDPSGNDGCPDAEATQPVSYCPATNTIAVDVPALDEYGEIADSFADGALAGDNTAYSMLMSRYMLALQNERGVPLDNADTALRTACMTGVAHAKLFDGVTDVNGGTLTLTAGDLDEAVSGMLTNGLAASNVNGETVPSGFSRIDAFRVGVLSADLEKCFSRFS